jgi:large repetitive protein
MTVTANLSVNSPTVKNYDSVFYSLLFNTQRLTKIKSMKKLYSLVLKIRSRFFYTLILTALAVSAFGQNTAPVTPPNGGFRIEGDLQANTPVVGIGDWVPGPPGSGGSVLNSAGTPLNPATTYNVLDPWNSSSDNSINGQANDNPNTWTWGLGNVPAKTDMQHLLMHFTTAPSTNHSWFIFGGDRWSTQGTSYQDFEFLQGTLTANTNGTFTSSGPHGGRTVNDLLFTVEFTNGGSAAAIQFYKWDTISPGVYDYVLIPANQIPANSAFGFTSAGGEPVPFLAFGQSTYLANQFVEGAVDLDAVIGAYVTSCSGINVHTFLTKTKTSASLSATLADMIGPLPLNITIGFTATTAVTSPNCFAQCTGTAIATVNGGTAPFTYTWNTSPVQSGQTATGLCAGTYTVTVRDSRPCTITSVVTITQPTQLNNTINPVPPTCFGLCNGQAIANPTGGTPNYTYAWSPGGQTGRTATNLCSGNYTVTVTDSKGCTRVTTVFVSQPNQVTASISSNSVSCFGGSNGSAIVTPGGGTGAYTYTWNPSGQNGQTATNLSSQTYTVTVRDANGCSVTATTTVTQPPVLSATTNHTNVTCFGLCNASAWATPSGGTPGYAYAWSTSPMQNGPTATGLCQGNYTVIVSDSRGCSTTQVVTITQPTQITASVSSTTSVTCNGACNGTAIATGGGGTGGYTYFWNPTGQTGQTATGLCANSYQVTITDANGCSTSSGFTAITQPAVLTSSATTIDSADCFGSSDGQIILSTSGGTGTYTYTWSPTGGNGPTASNLQAGCYTALVTDQNGCTTSASGCIQQPTQIVSAIGSQTNVSCNGGNDGSAAITGSGGSPQYTFSWSPSVSTTATASNLTVGNYTVIVTDANGCSTTTAVNITEPPALADTTNTINSTCSQSDGTAWVTVTGGAGSYTYAWTPVGGTGATANNLSAGNYTVTVTDANGCTIVDFASVSDATSPVISTTAVSDVSCNGDSTGSASVTVTSGGTPPFTYSWSTGDTTASIDSLTANVYNITVTDSNGCVASGSVTITQPPSLISSIASSTNVSCNSSGDGVAIVNVTGGSPSYTYSWSPAGGSGATASNLTPNTYTILVTDSLGCTASDTITITEPAVLATTFTVDSVGCHGESTGSIFTNTTGGTLGYTYSWIPSLPDSANQVGNLSAGTYTLIVTDLNGCTTSIIADVFEPDTIVPLIDAVTLNGVNITCYGDSNGIAYVDTIFGGTNPYIYVWSTGSGSDSITGLGPGQYAITVYDINGCSADTFISIYEPPPIAVQLSTFDDSCNNSCDGFITIDSTFGGVGGYTYVWSTTDTTTFIDSLCIGTYSVTITDLNGCTMVASANITEPAALSLGANISNYNNYNISCNGSSDGCVTVTVLGGSTPYSYVWAPSQTGGDTTDTFCNIPAGTYTVVITDANGCQLIDTFNLTEPAAVATTTDTTDVICNGDSTGTAFVSVSGGVIPYTYSWTPSGQTGATATGLAIGTYTVTVTDLNGCSMTTTATVTEPAQVTATTSTTAALCNGGATGTATVVAAGGVGAYTYLWNTSPAQSGQTATGLTQGTYTVIVTDQNGCSTSTTAVVNEPSQVAVTTTTNAVICNGDSTGFAVATGSGGVAGYTYTWTTIGQSGSTATNLAAGCYTVIVTDANGCTATDIACVSEPTVVTVAATTSPVICNGGATGSASATGGGGIPGYTYIWNPSSQVGATATNLAAGCYTVTATDANGCTSSTTVCVTEPTAVNVSVTATTVFCNTTSTGTAIANPSGGTGSYTYSWIPSGQTGQTATALPASSYTVVVTDANGCISAASASPTPTSIAVTAGQDDIICGLDDTLNAQIISATTPLQSNLWTGPTGNIINPTSFSTPVTNLQPGPNTFTWSITDANGCQTSAQVTITAYEDIAADALSDDTTICLVKFTEFQLLADDPIPGSGLWSIYGSNGNPNGIVSPPSFATQYNTGVAGQNILLWTVVNGPCWNQDTVTVTLKTDGECLDIDLPTGYTPNIDGYNDTYIIHGIEAYPENTFIVFNRWGNEVYHKDNYKNNGFSADWFGQNNDGDPLPDGTYYVILAIKNSALRLNTYVDLRR